MNIAELLNVYKNTDESLRASLIDLYGPVLLKELNRSWNQNRLQFLLTPDDSWSLFEYDEETTYAINQSEFTISDEIINSVLTDAALSYQELLLLLPSPEETSRLGQIALDWIKDILPEVITSSLFFRPGPTFSLNDLWIYLDKIEPGLSIIIKPLFKALENAPQESFNIIDVFNEQIVEIDESFPISIDLITFTESLESLSAELRSAVEEAILQEGFVINNSLVRQHNYYLQIFESKTFKDFIIGDELEVLKTLIIPSPDPIAGFSLYESLGMRDNTLYSGYRELFTRLLNDFWNEAVRAKALRGSLDEFVIDLDKVFPLNYPTFLFKIPLSQVGFRLSRDGLAAAEEFLPRFFGGEYDIQVDSFLTALLSDEQVDGQEFSFNYDAAFKQLILVDEGTSDLGPITSSSPGLFQEGVTLTVGNLSDDPDGIAVNPNLSYQWLRNGTIIPGATEDTYTVPVAGGSGDYQVAVTYTDGKGFTTTIESPIQVVTAVNNGSATLSPITSSIPGLFQEGVTLTVGNLSDDPDGIAVNPNLSYQWLRNGTIIPGATEDTYTVPVAGGSGDYQVAVTYTDGQGFTTTIESPIQVVTAVNNGSATLSPITSSIPGLFQEGVTLTVGNLNDDPDGIAVNPNLSYQWLRNGTIIPGATEDTYTVPVAGGSGDYQVAVTYTDGKGFTTTIESTIQVVTAVNNGSATLSPITSSSPGLFQEGVTLTVGNLSDDPDGIAVNPNLSYQWLRNGTIIPGATEDTYTVPVAGGSGDYQVAVTYTDGQGFTTTIESPIRQVLQIKLEPLRLDSATASVLYVAYYGRPADVLGLGFWQSTIAKTGFSYAPRAGDDLTDSERPLYDRIIVDFGESIESKKLYNNKSPKESADIVYNYCFGRDSEIDPVTGENYWVSKLEKKEITLSQLAAEVALGAQGQDLVYIRNKIASAEAFIIESDLPEEQAAFAGDQDNLIARTWLAGFGQSIATAEQASDLVNQLLATI